MRSLTNYGLILIFFLLAGCSQANADSKGDVSQRPINAVATTGMIADIVKNVGGERVTVVGLMGPGVDPHLYKATEKDVTYLQAADIIFYNGVHLEAQMGNVLESMEANNPHVIAISRDMDASVFIDSPQFPDAHDPHIWFDVTLWMQATKTVQAALTELDPSHASIYQTNAEKYLSELETLHAYVLAQAARVPEGQRILITAHDAFNYFGRAYGFEVRGLQGISTESEASTNDVQDLATFIADNKIPALFVESSVPRRTIEAVQAAVQAKGFDVQIGGQLYSDAMGNADTPDGTYQGMVRHNIDTIVNALLGQTQ